MPKATSKIITTKIIEIRKRLIVVFLFSNLRKSSIWVETFSSFEGAEKRLLFLLSLEIESRYFLYLLTRDSFINYRSFIIGKRITSLIFSWSVNNITKRSMPMPIPPAGGMPYSSASMKSLSISLASSSPNSLALS